MKPKRKIGSGAESNATGRVSRFSMAKKGNERFEIKIRGSRSIASVLRFPLEAESPHEEKGQGDAKVIFSIFFFKLIFA